jgi:hypothetical protein
VPPYQTPLPQVIFVGVITLLSPAESETARCSVFRGEPNAASHNSSVDHRGLALTSVLYPLAHLGLARAAMLQSDTPKARKSYEDFFAVWKDADSDLPILIEAKKEYDRLK